MRRRLPREVAELTFDLGLDVERLLAARDPARVAGLDELADLLEDLGIRRRRGPCELRELALDVDRRATLRRPAGVAGLEHLADVLLALRGADRSGRSARPRVQVAILADREPAAADVVVQARAAEQRDHRDHGAHADHDEDDGAECLLHPWQIVAHVATAATQDDGAEAPGPLSRPVRAGARHGARAHRLHRARSVGVLRLNGVPWP